MLGNRRQGTKQEDTLTFTHGNDNVTVSVTLVPHLYFANFLKSNTNVKLFVRAVAASHLLIKQTG